VKWHISKVFRFEAGHRVWKQNLTYGRGADFTVGKEIPVNKCVNLHGHSYVLEVVLGSDTLSEQDMVIDFYHVKNALKELIDTIDHSFIIDKADPMYPELKELAEKYVPSSSSQWIFALLQKPLPSSFMTFLKTN